MSATTMTPRQFRALFPEFAAASWHAWNCIDDVLWGQEPDDPALVRRLTARTSLPVDPPELWAAAGRGCGKSRMASRDGTYAACCREYPRVPGERIYVGIAAPDKRQAGVIYGYIHGLLHSVPALERLIQNETRDSIDLMTGVTIEVFAASASAPRGRAYALFIIDEACFLPSEDHSVDADRALLRAVRPALARVPGSKLLVISSPYAMRGELYKTWQTKFGKDDPHVLVVQGTTQDLNPSFNVREIERAYHDDPASAAAEYGAQFRSDVSDFFDAERLAVCIATDITERPPQRDAIYFAHIDPATGSASAEDACALSIARAMDDGRAVQVAQRVWQPPFSPVSVVSEAAALLNRYGIDALQGDRFAPGVFADLFRQQGIDYSVSERDTSAQFIELLALVNSGTVELLDDDLLLGQLRGLERRTRPGGHDRVGHRSRAHDDVAAACAGSLVLAAAQMADGPALMLYSTDPASAYQQSQRARTPQQPAPEPDDDSDGDEPEVIEATEEEMAARPDAAEWIPFVPRAERKRRHHENAVATAERDGYFFPEDDR